MRGINNYIDFLLFLLCYFLYAWQASCFLKRHLQGKSSEREAFFGLLFCSHGIMAAFLERENIPYILYAMCNHAMLVGLTMAVFKGEKEKKLLAAVILEVMTELFWNFSESFLCCLGLILVKALPGGRQAVSVGVWGDRIITVMTYTAGITAVNRMSKLLKPVFTEKRKSWYLCLAMPLFCIIFVTDVANWAASNGIMVQDWGRYGLYENQLFSHGAMCIFTGLAMAAAGVLIFGMDRIEREERTREQYRSQVMYYQMMEEQYRQMERLRHDMKNHVIALNNLVQNRQWEKAGSYLGEMARAGGVEAGDEITGSLVTDALLYHKRRQAIKRGILWKCDARLPKDCLVKEIDLCIIVGNALDNALEACGKLPEKDHPFIQVYLGKIKKCLFIEVRNSADIEDGWENKKNPGEHGLGLENIKAAVDSYNGTVHVEAQKGVFTISILLPM